MRNSKRACLVILCAVMTFEANAMDRARQETGADQAIAAYGLSGAGVTVVILDRGIDYFHPDFRNADGITNFLYLQLIRSCFFQPPGPSANGCN